MSDAETLGAELRTAREARELSLDQAEQQTRIRAFYLEALEQGNYAELPSAVQGRGFLRNYARFLGLDGDALALRFDSVLRLYNSRRGNRQPLFSDDQTLPSVTRRTVRRTQSMSAVPPRSAATSSANTPTNSTPDRATARAERNPSRTSRQSRTRNMTLGTLAIAIISLIGLFLIVLYVTQTANPQPTNSSILNPLPSQIPATDVPLPTDTPDHPTPLPNPQLPNPNGAVSTSVAPVSGSGNGSGVVVQIVVKERNYLKITSDDTIVYSGSAPPDTNLQFAAKKSIVVHTSDAGSIEVTVNGVVQGALGQRKTIVDKTYTANTPLPAISPPPSAVGAPTSPAISAAITVAAPSLNLSIPSKTSPLAALAASASPIAPTVLPTTVAPSTTALPVTTVHPSASPLPTRTPSLTPTTKASRLPPTATPMLSMTSSVTSSPPAVLLPHDTITPDSRPN